jgi:hypothetical protein
MGVNVLNRVHRMRKRHVVFQSAEDEFVGLVWARRHMFAAGC